MRLLLPLLSAAVLSLPLLSLPLLSLPATAFAAAPNAAVQGATCAVPRNVSYYDYDVKPSDEKNTCYKKSTNVPTDSFVLALSWSPGFCDSQRRRGEISKKAAFQCSESNHFGWIVHGLWAQSDNPATCEDISVTPPRKTDLHPRYCKGDLPKLSPAEILPYMCMQPGEALLQGEWEKHGACDFDTAKEYFEKERELYQALNLPATSLPKNQLFQWMKQHNPQLKGRWLGYEKHSGELRICYSKDYKVIDCKQ